MKLFGFCGSFQRLSIFATAAVLGLSSSAYTQEPPINGGNLFSDSAAPAGTGAPMALQQTIDGTGTISMQLNFNQGVFDADTFELNLPAASPCSDGNPIILKSNIGHANLRGFHLSSFRGSVRCSDGTVLGVALGAGQHTGGVDSFKLEVPGLIKIDAHETGVADVQVQSPQTTSVSTDTVETLDYDAAPIMLGGELGISTLGVDEGTLSFGTTSSTQNLSSFQVLAAPPTQPVCNDNNLDRSHYADILFGYTSEAKRDACAARAGCDNTSPSSARYILEDIQMAVERANQAFCNSGISYRVRASGAYQLPSEGTASIGIPSGSLRIGSDVMNFANSIASRGKLTFLTANSSGYRDRYQADLVSVVISNTGKASPTDAECGFATQGPSNATNAHDTFSTSGVSVISRDCLSYHQLTKSVGSNLAAAATNYSDSITISGVTGFNSVMSIQLPNKRIGCFAGDGAICCDDRVGATGVSAGQCVTGPSATPNQITNAITNMPAAIGVNAYSGITRTVPSSASNLPGKGYTCDFNENLGLHTNCIQTALGESQDGDVIQVLPAPNCFVNDGNNLTNYCYSGQLAASTNQPGDRYIEHLQLATKSVSLIGLPGSPESVKISGNGTPFLPPYESAAGTPAISHPIHNYDSRPGHGEGDAIVLRTGGNFNSTTHPTTAYPHQIISGLTLTDGMGTSTAGGFWCIGGVDIYFSNNIVENNLGIEGRGAGMSIESCSGVIEKNVIRGNKLLGKTSRQFVGAVAVNPTPVPPTEPDYTYTLTNVYSPGFPGWDRDGTCWMRANTSEVSSSGYVSDPRYPEPVAYVSCINDSETYYDFIGNNTSYAYVGGAGIRVSTSRYWADEYPQDAQHMISIRDNLIYKNEVPQNIVMWTSTTVNNPSAVGAGIQLYGQPAVVVNNTIIANGPSACVGSSCTASQQAHTDVPNVYVAVSPWSLFYASLFPSSPSAPVKTPQTGFGIGCVGRGPEKSFIHNNIIADNDLNVSDFTSAGSATANKVLYNYDCPQAPGVAQSVDLGNNLTDSPKPDGTCSTTGGAIGANGAACVALSNVMSSALLSSALTAVGDALPPSVPIAGPSSWPPVWSGWYTAVTALKPMQDSAANNKGMSGDARIPSTDISNATWAGACAGPSYIDIGASDGPCTAASSPTNPARITGFRTNG